MPDKSLKSIQGDGSRFAVPSPFYQTVFLKFKEKNEW